MRPAYISKAGTANGKSRFDREYEALHRARVQSYDFELITFTSIGIYISRIALYISLGYLVGTTVF